MVKTRKTCTPVRHLCGSRARRGRVNFYRSLHKGEGLGRAGGTTCSRADAEVASAWPGDTVQTPAADRLKSWTAAASGIPLAVALAVFAAAFLVPAWPWLSGAVTIPWDAKAQFLPQLQFLARSLAEGQSPFWTPNVFAGWPQIADPQSLIFHRCICCSPGSIRRRAFAPPTR